MLAATSSQSEAPTLGLQRFMCTFIRQTRLHHRRVFSDDSL
jgi:hypothetical protein